MIYETRTQNARSNERKYSTMNNFMTNNYWGEKLLDEVIYSCACKKFESNIKKLRN